MLTSELLISVFVALLYITAPFSQFIETSGEAPGTTEEIIKRAEKAIEIAKKYDKNELKLEDLKGNLAAYQKQHE
jgi:hypothetical protein